MRDTGTVRMGTYSRCRQNWGLRARRRTFPDRKRARCLRRCEDTSWMEREEKRGCRWRRQILPAVDGPIRPLHPLGMLSFKHFGAEGSYSIRVEILRSHLRTDRVLFPQRIPSLVSHGRSTIARHTKPTLLLT